MSLNKKIGVISLGCDKNRVDTEKMLYFIRQKHTLTDDVNLADVVVINTCAFLESARKEAIGEILSVADLKKNNANKKIIVTGCLPQKFINEIYNELSEVDGFLGVSDYDKINLVIDEVLSGKRVNCVGNPSKECGKKRVLTTDNYAYLKIADGCFNHCTYCLIPYIRGKYRSVSFNDLIDEASGLGTVKELILVAQDTTSYGKDLGDLNLTMLIQSLSKLENIGSIRLLYCYPEGITEELIEEFANNPKLIKYIDIPFQHADDRILKLMNRKGTGKGYLELINKLKARVDGIAIRSTFITGFPTEDESAFDNLAKFVMQAKLFNAGFFAYSREEGTPAYKLDGQLPQSVKTKRLKKLYSIQNKVAKQLLKQFEGKTIKVLAEGFDENMSTYYGRAYFSAPNIDGKVYFFSSEEVEYGEYYDVLITQTEDYDLYGDRL